MAAGPGAGLRILVACDKFKGSLTAEQVRDAVVTGARQALPGAAVRGVLVSDGGDGFLDLALAAGFTRVPVIVSGPTGAPVRTSYAVRSLAAPPLALGSTPPLDSSPALGSTSALGSSPALRSSPSLGSTPPPTDTGPRNNRGNPEQRREVVVEMADACGLVRLPDQVAAPMTASSRGLGEVILAALERERPHRILIGIGGSASTDGGAGLVTALGARVLDAAGEPVPPGGQGLARAAALDLSALARRMARPPELLVACDVDAPLTGPRGAARVFAPQKGATPEQVERLDLALTRWADVVASTIGHDLRETPGAGAAGGVGFAAVTLLGATLRRGVDLALDLADFEAALFGEDGRAVDLVLTGEGSLDGQSLSGKTPIGVAQRAAAHGIPVVAVCGQQKVSDEEVATAGIGAVHALSDLEADPLTCMAEAAGLLTELTRRAVTAWCDGRTAVGA